MYERISRFAVALVVLSTALSSYATTIVLPADAGLVAKAPLIISGLVVRSEAVERAGGIWTETEIEVEQTLKGTAPARIIVREIGGIVGDRITKLFGTPEYVAGERVLAFVAPTARGDYQTVDLFVGKFTEGRTMNGQRLWLRDPTPDGVQLLDGSLDPIPADNPQRDAAAFENFIKTRHAGIPAVTNYIVSNPILEGSLDSRSDGRFSVRPDFELISEPTIYRWSGFDTNVSAAWYSHGTQSGYASGGVSELQTAMGSWTGYGSAKILYTYAGVRTAAPGGLDTPNGVNEVMFEDPRSEITGSWSSSTGGVVGQGGFNGVANTGNWTSPFAADAVHGQGTFQSFRITEGNLTIQNGVSSSSGIPSSRLAEIIAHEFGHTLGFGHSSDSSALMYFSVTGLGPSLRSDDQVAARWLYPNGTVTPPPAQTAPNAPTNLTASVSGSSAALQWSDNSANENGFSVWVASGSGSFSKVTDLAAGRTSVSLTGFTSGSYRIYVTAFNGAGQSAASNTVTVTVSAQLAAAFSVSPGLTGLAGTTTFTFTDESSGSVTSRQWQFGDGGTATGASATHVYTTAGFFTVTLTVSGGGAQSQTAKNMTVTAPPAPLAANFTWSPATPTTTTDVPFTDLSTGGVTSWQWNFGDGTASSTQNPVKRYPNAGTYGVTLTVFRNSESRVASKTITITAPLPSSPSVGAAFSYAPSSPVAGAPVTFTDASTGTPTTWSWDFGDGATAASQSASHAFAAAGTYTVSLVAANAAGSALASKQVVVSAGQPFRTLISATAATTGVGGSNWRTELTIYNAGPSTAQVELVFVPGAGGSSQLRSLFLVPRQSVTYSNVLSDAFGLLSGAGAISISGSGVITPDLRVASRTYTEGAVGTYGQDVPGVFSEELTDSLYLPGLESSSAYRTNIGIVNARPDASLAVLSLLDADGTFLGSTNVTLPGNNFQQASLGAYFPLVASGSRSGMTLRVSSGAPGSVSAYGSVVDNRTQDPVFVQGVGAPSGTSLILPVVGRAPGANATFWRSDVTIFNPRTETLGLTLRYIGAGTDGRNGITRGINVAGGRTMTIADVLSTFSVTAGSGALEISWSGGAGPVVTSRTYTSTEGGGTFGQSITPASRFSAAPVVTGLRNDSSFRSNIGVVNRASSTIGVGLTLVGASGETVGTSFVELAPKSQKQFALRDLFGSVASGSYTLMATSDAGSVFIYGSVIDNRSGDPVFYSGR